MTLLPRLAVAALIVVAIGAGAAVLLAGGVEGRSLSLSLLLGAAFGVVLQRGRFCFYCNFRDLIEHREPAGVLAILVALAVGAVGYTLIFGAWLPDPGLGRLPPTAHIGPVSVVLGAAALVFGLGMAVSGSCLSAHFYRLGEGAPVAPFAIVGAFVGFGTGFLTWNGLFLGFIQESPALWLPQILGYAGTLALTLGALAALAVLALWLGRPQPLEGQVLTLRSAVERVFARRWPPVVTGLAIGGISTVAYLRIAPLGVTAELGSLSRTAGDALGLLPDVLHGLDGFRGCMTVIKQALLSDNGLFVIGLIAASFASALVAGQYTPRLPSLRDAFRGLAGGLLLGWGAMTALGCTVGVLLSGIHAGAVSGWVFLAFCALGIVVGLPLGRRLERRAG